MAEPGEALSEREREIIHLVATGATNRMIAQELTISPNTVKVHLRNIFTKLEISSRTEATVIAIREGWVDVSDGEGEPRDGPGDDETPSQEEAVEEIPEWLRGPLPWMQRMFMVVSILLVVTVSTLA